jgi:hypothetical protein
VLSPNFAARTISFYTGGTAYAYYNYTYYGYPYLLAAKITLLEVSWRDVQSFSITM